MNPDLQSYIDRAADRVDLSAEQTDALFTALAEGRLPDDEIERLLIALADKGETVDELTAAARVLRRHVVRIRCDDPHAIDTCGTGGDGISTFNVSTAAAIVAAAAGARVAKHGNRTRTRRSGSVEVLTQLGINLDCSHDLTARCLAQIGIAFLHAARLHPAAARAAPIRARINRPTIFNLLGPLANPAFVTRQIIGVPRPDLLDKIAQSLLNLGAVHAWVVHGHDRLCDLSITGPSDYIELRDGRLRAGTVRPEGLGLSPAPLSTLLIEGPAQSAAAIRSILAGQPGPRRDHVLLNAAAALVVAGRADELRSAITLAAAAIDSGRAALLLARWADFTHPRENPA